jgi:hypothetical protein
VNGLPCWRFRRYHWPRQATGIALYEFHSNPRFLPSNSDDVLIESRVKIDKKDCPWFELRRQQEFQKF